MLRKLKIRYSLIFKMSFRCCFDLHRQGSRGWAVCRELPSSKCHPCSNPALSARRRRAELSVKPRQNDCNISTQHIPKMLAQHLQAPSKRLQHFSATDRNIVECNMLHTYSLRHVTSWKSNLCTCLDAALLQESGQTTTTSCNIHKFCMKKLTTFKFKPTTPNMSQHVATRSNRVVKRTQHVAPNNVAICCVEMLRSFGRGFRCSLVPRVFPWVPGFPLHKYQYTEFYFISKHEHLYKGFTRAPPQFVGKIIFTFFCLSIHWDSLRIRVFKAVLSLPKLCECKGRMHWKHWPLNVLNTAI